LLRHVLVGDRGLEPAGRDERQPTSPGAGFDRRCATRGGSSAGESIDISKRVVADQKEFDVDELEVKLAQWKQAWDKRDDLIVAPEDGVRYEDVVRAMDVAAAAGFEKLSMADGAAFL
jgi:hypothetical protein